MAACVSHDTTLLGRWSKEYLTSLQLRDKWQRPQRSLELGDLAALKDESMPPCQWPLGTIAKVHPGPDGLVRAVIVETAWSQYERPYVKVVLLAKINDLRSG